jgi:glucose-1-phosphate adenylyltransferase
MPQRLAKTIGMVLAGGKGTRLHPLTWKRTKPAVPFGAKYRIIDFALNNMINSGIFGMYVLTQYKAQSLTEHIQRNWRFGTFFQDYFITWRRPRCTSTRSSGPSGTAAPPTRSTRTST